MTAFFCIIGLASAWVMLIIIGGEHERRAGIVAQWRAAMKIREDRERAAAQASGPEPVAVPIPITPPGAKPASKPAAAGRPAAARTQASAKQARAA